MKSVLIVIFFFSELVTAQFVPLTAKHREVSYRLNVDGTKTMIAHLEGRYLRTTSGSELTILQRAADDPRPGGSSQQTATFADASTGKVYRVSYAQKFRMHVGDKALPFHPTDFSKTPTKGSDTINGISLHLRPE